MYRESSYSMILKAPSGKEVNLSIINIEDLKPHENTISELLSSLITDIHTSATQKDPILVDSNSDKGKVAVLTGSGALISSESLEKLEAYSRMARFDKICMLEGLKVAFASESSVFDHLKSSSSLIVYPPMLTKSEILEIAKSRKLLPWKTTRHIVPLRVLGIEFPVEILKKNDEIGKIQESLSSTLQGRDIEFRLPNTIYEGREYPEPLAIFRPKKRIC